MDPNENLSRQRGIVSDITELRELGEAHVPYGQVAVLAYELAELVSALDEWLAKGGFLPNRWQ